MADQQKVTTSKSLIIGPSGAGKSWLTSTLPGPRCIFDLEGRARRTPAGRKATIWDGEEDPMALEKSESRTYIVDCTNTIMPMTMATTWLETNKHPFVSLGVDSLMETQYREIREMFPDGKVRRDQWNDVLLAMENKIRPLLDLVKEKENPVRHVLLIAGAITKDEKWKSLMQGQITVRVPYWMDLCGYLDKEWDSKKNKEVRKLYFTQREQNDLEVKDGTDDVVSKLGSPIDLGDRGDEPNMETILNSIELV